MLPAGLSFQAFYDFNDPFFILISVVWVKYLKLCLQLADFLFGGVVVSFCSFSRRADAQQNQLVRKLKSRKTVHSGGSLVAEEEAVRTTAVRMHILLRERR